MAAKFPLPPMTNPTFNCLNEITLSLIDVIKPPERLSITESAARYRYLNNQGSFVGFWRNTTTPYLVAPTNMLMSPDHEAVIFVGAAQTGKGLALNERIATPTGWTTVGELCVGDVIFSEKGQLTTVKYLSPITHRDCYRITFDDGSSVVADDVHRWVFDDRMIDTAELYLVQNDGRSRFTPAVWGSVCGRVPYILPRRLVGVEKINSVPTRCLTVDAPSHLFLVGDAMIPTHNTDALILNWTLYSIKVDPMDIIIYNPTTAAARDFSLRRIDRLNRHSPEVGKLLMKGRTADNRLDKHYSTGTFLSLSHPSQTELAGKPIPRVALTDYDRMPEDIDGDGSPFDLASKRTTSFGSFAMTLAESSPSRPLENPRWIAKTAHEAPPTTGILALYNRGDRRRWYWPCPHCGEHFEGEFHHLQWDDTQPTVLQQAESVHMVCPNNGCVIREESKFEMNLDGVWLRDGQAFNKDQQIIGVGARNKIASFWMKGVAAAFASWPKLVSTYLAALQEYEQTGSEEALKKFYNTDLAEIYLPKDGLSERTPEQLKSRAEFLGEKVVPEGVRFLIASVDVQKNAFIVQVHGISPGSPYDVCIVDRFSIFKSNRLDDDGEHSWVKPATYLEDWDILIEEVINKEYPLADGSGRKMLMRYTVCDSGGKAGVTANAYQFYRNLKERNLHGRFHLVKGDSKPGQSRTRITYPDASKRDKHSAARGDVPVLMLNSNVLKDQLNGRLDCMAVGKGMWRFPDWLPDWFFMELCSERRTNKGWENPSHSRNEAWDLGYYCLGICASRILMIEKFDWASPPRWAAEWDQNDMVRAATESPRFAVTVKKDYDFSKFGESIG